MQRYDKYILFSQLFYTFTLQDTFKPAFNSLSLTILYKFKYTRKLSQMLMSELHILYRT